MDRLRPALRRDYPDFDAKQAFEVALPVYFIRLSLEVLEPQTLTNFQSYFRILSIIGGSLA